MRDVAQSPLRPAELARLLLNALDVSAATSRRRKRDQKPDAVGLSLKRALLERMVGDDPDPDMFGDWLLDEILAAPASGARRAMGAEILDEYRLATADAGFARWLVQAAAAGGRHRDSPVERGPRPLPSR